MNLHKLQKLLDSPKQESMTNSLKGSQPYWDYRTNKCKYFRRDYGQAYSFATKLIERHVGKPFFTVVQILKNNPRYKYQHFFREGVDEAIAAVKNNTVRCHYDNSYYLSKSDYTVVKKEPLEPRRKSLVNNNRDLRWREEDGVAIQRLKGIHYQYLSHETYKIVWDPIYGLSHKAIPEQRQQLSKYWLKYYKLKNRVDV